MPPDCCTSQAPQTPSFGSSPWNRRYLAAVTALAALWWLAYTHILKVAQWLVYDILALTKGSRLGAASEFFVYDIAKILLLLAALIYAISWLRATLAVERVRAFLADKQKGVGYFLGSLFGAITPFCSCSSIPLFLGFLSAGIPTGITMAFLITSPLINEIAVVLLWGLLGWKFTLAYVLAGILAGTLGGWLMDRIRAERWLQPFIKATIHNSPQRQLDVQAPGLPRLSIRQRHIYAYGETALIFRRIWKWVILGVGVGAALHGFVPDNWFAENFSAKAWWSVPAAVLVGIPLYSNVTGIIPIMESLLLKGLPLGTTMAFCMSAVVASIPELVMLRQIMTIKLQASFTIYLWTILTLVGWLFNAIGPWLL